MMRDDVKIWIAIEYAREDEAGHRCRGLIRPTKRPPDLILRSVFGLVISEPLTPRGVHPNWFATLPIVAIGGININNYKKLLLNNANLLAISGYVWNNKKYKPLETIEKLK